MTLSSADYRGGYAPLRTASELAVILPIPLLLILEGYARPLFPGSTPAHPSPFVVVVGTKPKGTYPPVTGLPLNIHWSQWESVVVPVLETGSLASWRGQITALGELLLLLNDILDAEGNIVFPEGFEMGYSAWTEEGIGRLYACDPNDRARVGGKSAAYLEQSSALILRVAGEAGIL